jgi:mono/diheme cytochrome c family protein
MTRAAAILMLACVAAPAKVEASETLFNDACAACHQTGGAGNPGVAPPLNDAILWQRLGDRAPAYLAGVMISGLTGTIDAGGQMFAGLAMPSQAAMPDDDLAAIGTYVLSTLNNTGFKLDPTTVAAIRQAPPSHAALRKPRYAGKLVTVLGKGGGVSVTVRADHASIEG